MEAPAEQSTGVALPEPGVRPRMGVLAAFVTDGFWRKSVAAVRGLARAGIRVHVGESTPLAPALWSRHVVGRCVYPSPRTAPEAFLERLGRECRRRRIDVLLPMEEETLALVLDHPEALPGRVRVAAGSRVAFRAARDKAVVQARAAALGIATPWTRAPETPAEVDAAVAAAPLPAVVKPRVGSGGRGLRYVETREALAAAVREIALAHGPVLVQERIPAGAEGLGASLCLDEAGRLRAAFVHRRVREYPLTGGAATLAESIHDPALVAQAHALLRDLGLHGPAMVEFRRDPRDGVPRCLEVNPRFWGSLALALAAGVNFPAIAHDVARGTPAAPPPRYRAGVRCRFLLPGDLLHFLGNLRRWRPTPAFFRANGRGPNWDLWAADDPGPAAGQAAALLPLLARREWRRYVHA